jgi:spore germination cell wall hydrolase CwlJ-like protein
MKLAWLLWLASALPQPVADRTCLAATIYLEAQSQSALGQLAVAEVAQRRRTTGRWGKNLCDVVGARDQFALSTTSKSYIFDNTDSWKTAWDVSGASIAMWWLPEQWRIAVVPKADHFLLASSMIPSWVHGAPLATIGEHNFYHVID